MPVSFEDLKNDGLLAPIHVALAESFRRLDRDVPDEVVLAAALASEQLSRGHVCLDLDSLPGISFQSASHDAPARTISDWPNRAAWARPLRNSSLVTAVEPSDIQDNWSPDTPVVFDEQHGRVYLARYWHYEQTLAGLIRRRVNSPLQSLDEARLQQDIETLFPDRETPGGRGQCLAAANAIDRSFAVITGGPGTGKTTTVARLLALRLLQSRATSETSGHVSADGNENLRVLLMAPTGKAAQRLNESLQRAAGRLQVDDGVRAALNEITAGTIHRVLGWTPTPPERGGPFRHNADHPLDADIVLVDEASMVDVGLMCRLFEAVPADAQIILMGDRDQLASVEAGGILGDLCGDLAGEALNVDAERRQVLASRTGLDLTLTKSAGSKQPESTPLQQSIVALTFSHRFSSESQLGQLAAAIRSGNADTAIALLTDSNADSGQIEWLHGRDFNSTIDEVVRRAAIGYSGYLEQLKQNPAGNSDVLTELNRHRVLCAHRDGLAGESTLNRRIADRLSAIGLIRPVGQHYAGRPVMVTRNDYRLNLFNGDVGVAVRGAGPGRRSSSEILFEDSTAEDELRRVPDSLVPDAQDCFAMTIHKSQGSEFHQVLLVLPPMDSPVLSRELLYTAVTRVKDELDAETGKSRPGRLCLAASESVVRATIAREIRRTSGIRDAIQPQRPTR